MHVFIFTHMNQISIYIYVNMYIYTRIYVYYVYMCIHMTLAFGPQTFVDNMCEYCFAGSWSR